MTNQQLQPQVKDHSTCSGFTLVEMLVSVTLVLLMMTLFTSIFSMATDSVSRQKGISELDQGARILSNAFRSDVAKRTFRYVMPYYPGENPDTTTTSFGNRPGYIYFSANDPASGIDDVLQFTVNSELTTEEADVGQFLGASAMLYDQVAEAGGGVRRTALAYSANQPEADDSVLVPNGVAASKGAEVSYFLRNGALYRRVMLLRDPLGVIGGEEAVEPRSLVGDNPLLLNETDLGATDTGGRFWYVGTPSAVNPNNRNNYQLTGSATAVADRPAWNVKQSNDFWQHFDLSAKPSGAGGGSNPSTGVQLIGVSALGNDTVGGGGLIPSLGNPAYRWGFNFYTGQSREHMNAAGTVFMGRFLAAETSDWRFNWPMSGSRSEPEPPASGTPSFSGTLLWDSNTNAGNPMDVSNTLTRNFYGIAAEFDGVDTDAGNATDFGRGGPRKVEDLLLANVHEFRVEIWDERAGRYVVPGYGRLVTGDSAIVGDYHIRRCIQRDSTTGEFLHGPLAPYLGGPAVVTRWPHVFDTWHPDLAADPKFDFNTDGVSQLHEVSPPYLPYRLTPPLFPAGPTSTFVDNPIDSETVKIRQFTSNGVVDSNVTNRGYMQFSGTGAMYQFGDAVFVKWNDAPQPDPANPPLGMLPPDGLFQYNEVAEPKFHIGYRCVFPVPGDPAASPGPEPPTISWPKTPGQRITFGGTQWEAFDNRQPLKSMRLKIRFQDPSTESLRQVTLNLPLTVDD